MAAPLSSFMTQLLDDSISRQNNNSTHDDNLYQDSDAFPTTTPSVGSGAVEENDIDDDDKDEADQQVNIEKSKTGEKALSPTSVAEIEPPRMIPTTAVAVAPVAGKSSVPDKMALRNYRKGFRDEAAAATATAAASGQSGGKNNSSGLDESSIHLHDSSSTKNNRSGNTNNNSQNNNGSFGNSGNTMNQSSSNSLAMFMTQLLNDSDIEKLIREGDHSTAATSTTNGKDIDADGKSLSGTMNHDNNKSSNTNSASAAAHDETTTHLSRGAADVLTSAIQSLPRKEEQHSQPASKAPIDTLNESHNNDSNRWLNNTNINNNCSKQDLGNDVDGENSKSTVLSNKSNARQPTRRKQNTRQQSESQPQPQPEPQPQQQNQNPPEKPSSVSHTSVFDLSLEAAKECLGAMAQIDALIRPKGPALDPYSLVQRQTKVHPTRQRRLVRHNSDSSLMSSNTNNNTNNNKSMIGNKTKETEGFMLQGSCNTAQSLSITGLRQELKKSASLSHLRAQMTRLTSKQNIYSMDLAYEGDDEINDDAINESSRLDYNYNNDNENETRGDTEIEKELDREIEVAEAEAEEKRRRARSNTPRKNRTSSAKRSSSSTNLGIAKSKRAPSVDPGIPGTPRSPSLGTSKKRGSSGERRGRTPNGRKRASSAVPKTRASSALPKMRATSSSHRKHRSSSVLNPSKTSRSKSGNRRHGRATSASPAEPATPNATGKTPRRRQSTAAKMGGASSKRDKSSSRRGMRSIMDDKVSKREHSLGTSKRASRALGSSGDLNDATMPPATPRVKSPSTRSRRPSMRTAGTSSDAAPAATPRTKKSTASPRTPRGARTPRTPSANGRTPRKNKAPSRSNSTDGAETNSDSDPKFKLRRTKTIDSTTVTPKTPSSRRRSMAGGTSQDHHKTPSSRSKSTDETEPSANGGKHVVRRVKTTGSSPATPSTPSAQRASAVENFTASLRRKRENIAAKDPTPATLRIPRRNGVAGASAGAGGNPPRRQQSDPAPFLNNPAMIAEEAAQAAKELQKRRIRSRSTGTGPGTGPGPGSSATSSMESSEQNQRSSGRRGARQRQNLQAQQSLRHALNEDIKTKEAVEHPLVATPTEGKKEATWLTRRKNRLAVAQQAQARTGTQ